MKSNLFKSLTILFLLCLVMSVCLLPTAYAEASADSFQWPTTAKHINCLDHFSSGGEHGGIDVSAALNSPVYAVASGRVVRIGNDCAHHSAGSTETTSKTNYTGAYHNCYATDGWGEYGNYIVLQHTIGGTTYTSVYAQLKQNSFLCAVGDQVSAGQQIALSGDSGNATGPHLHFEIYDGQFRGSIRSLRSQSFKYYQSNPTVLSGMTFSSHMNTSSTLFGNWVEANCTLTNGVWRYNGSTTDTETYTLNIDGNLNGGHYYNIEGIGQFDVYINGVLDAQNVNEYNKKWPAGTSYEVRNIRADAGYLYGSSDYPLGGTLSKDSLIILYFFAKYDVVFDANGGIDAPANQVKIKGYDLTLASDTPHRTGYSFLGWATSSNAQTAEYQPGDKYSSNQNVVFYAVWRSNLAINEQNFPDPTFRSYVSEHCDTDKDGYLSAEEIANVRSIDINGEWDNPGSLTSLKGIEFFTRLYRLSCQFNKLEELNVSSNAELTFLSCCGNQLSSLNISENILLTYLDCSNNPLQGLSLNKNDKLTVLYCNDIQLSELDISRNTELETLWCDDNQLTELNISTNSKLKWLNCDGNNLTELDVSHNKALLWLLCERNQLTEIDISHNAELTDLHCGENQIKHLDLSGNEKLALLWCYNNQLNELDISHNIDLSRLVCWGNQIKRIDLNNCPALVSLVNGSTDGNGSYHDEVTGHELYCDSSVVLFTEPLTGVGIAIDEGHFPDEAFRSWISVNCDVNHDSVLCEAEINAITEINVSGPTVSEPGPITSLKGIEYFSALKTLYCANNQLTELDISKNTQLEGLACGFSFGDVYLGNQLKSLDVSHNPALVTLYCDNNQLTALNVSNNTNLNVLMCSNNQLTSLDVSNNRELYWLYCWGNQLTELDVGNNTKLMQFSCAQNQISQLDVSKNTGLVIFYCNNNQIEEINVRNCSNLQELSVSKNQLAELDVSNCTQLQKLLCAWNDISELDVSGCPDLQSFECGANPLGSLNISNNPALWHLGCFENQLTELDLSNNTALQEMWCYSNQLENLDLSNCTGLVFLSCWDNGLTELNLRNNSALQRLFCYQNQLPYLDITACSDLIQLTQSSAPVIDNSVVRFASETDPVWIVYDLDTPLKPKSAFGYTIEYNLNGGAGEPINQTKYAGNTLQLSSVEPRRENNVGYYTVTFNAKDGIVSPASIKAENTTSYTFKNWNTATDGSGTSYAPGADYTADADVTLYAQWNSSTSTESITLPTPIRTGYSFRGWGLNDSATTGVTGNYTPNEDIILYAIWEADKYSISYDANGGSGEPTAQKKPHGTPLILSSTIPVREGYTFVGWAGNSSASVSEYQPGEQYTDDAEIILYAVWAANTYTVSFDANGGTVSPTSKTVKYGEPYGDLPLASRNNYRFDGWFTSADGGTQITGSTTVSLTANQTLYAHWIYVSTASYTVFYDANGGTGTPSSQIKEENVSLTLSSLKPTKNYIIQYNATGGSVSPASKNTSCTFISWNTAIDGSGYSFAPGSTYTDNANVTLFAQWTNPLAGTLAIPSRTGYEFAGWYTSAGGGELITDSSIITENITIYAHWIDPYNMGDETYSFENYDDYHGQEHVNGHCYGMSMTSAGYHIGALEISRIGGNINTPLYSFADTQRVRLPICYYTDIQGSFRENATVAGGSYYIYRYSDIASDWQEVVDFVRNHEFDETGLLQIGFRKNYEGGHAINFLRYENVNGQDRIYAYDNNFPEQETYFYQDSSGKVWQAPVQTFSGSIDCIALRDCRIYFDSVGDYDSTHVIYMPKDSATIEGYSYSYMEDSFNDEEYIMYEIPSDQDRVIIIPKRDYANFIYMDTEYSFGEITDGTRGELKFASLNEGAASTVSNFRIFESAPEFGEPDFTLPSALTEIGESAFEGLPMTIVEIPSGCENIGKWAFKDCASLTQIRIPSSVAFIEDTAFDGCTNVFIYGAANSAAKTFCDTHTNCTFVAEDTIE